MSTLTKMARTLFHAETPTVAPGVVPATITLPPPRTTGGLPLMEALALRRSSRSFDSRDIAPEILSDLLWSAFGVNRAAGHERTAPSARDDQEIDVYAATRAGLWRYDAAGHRLLRVASIDARKVTGFQDFVDQAPLDLVYVARHRGLGALAPEKRMVYSAVSAGAIAENVYLYCAGAGLATVVRGWFSEAALAEALGLGNDQHVILAQTVGWPAVPAKS